MTDLLSAQHVSACAENVVQYYPGLAVYLMHKGEKGLPVFFEDNDYEFYLELLQQGLRRHQVRLHSYALLDDAAHLLLTPMHEFSITQVIEHVASIYGLYLNRKYHCQGMGFDQQLSVCSVVPQDFLLKCSRYIESYALCENLDIVPEQYRWSSFHFNARGRKDDLITPHSLYLLLGKNKVQRYLNYQDMFDTLLPTKDIFAIKRALNTGEMLMMDKHSKRQRTQIGC